MNTIWLAFLTGLTTGGLSCLAVQGGLLATAVSNKGDGRDMKFEGAARWKEVFVFIVAKLIGYTILGFLLGWAGSLLVLSPKVLGTIQIGAGLFMLATAARLANIHPVFRYFVIEPPRWVYRLMRKISKDPSHAAPAILGFTTILMPCGVTQATMIVAVASANPLMGAAIMFAFVLGTSPVFFALGAAVVELMKRKIFTMFAAALMVLFAFFTINGGLGLMGSMYTAQNIYLAAVTPLDQLAVSGGNVAGAVITDGVQDVTIDVLKNKYIASTSVLKVNVPVRLTLKTDNVNGCTRAFTIPDFRIVKVLPETGEAVVEFTPTKTGRLAYSCAMGMYTGAFTVVP